MTIRRRRRREDVFSSPKFFKLIVDPTAHHLRIPAEFMKRHGRNLPNRVFLKVPNTRVSREVELIRSNAETLLQNGWKEFSDRYSLCFGHFLMFEYNGNSEFDVLIFDRTASEINYPGFELESEPSGTESESEDESILPKPKIATRSRMKRKRSSFTGRVKRKQKSIEKETSMAYHRAVGFAEGSSIRNPFFISIMRPTYIDARFGLEIPIHFVNGNYLPGCKSSSVTVGIKNDERKVWAIKLWCSLKRAKLSSGWKDFVKDNGLKVGDACLFQVVNNSHWNVVIFKS